jgi:2',3'-cyclic-nucleotide 2'-phosphodiesterase (5'-nucleotidase family)
VVDSGDLFFKQNTLPDGLKIATDAKADVMLRILAKQDCKAAAVGDRDLGIYGVEGLKKLTEKASFPFLCANLVDDKDKPVFTPHVLVEAAGFKIGIFALLTPGANLDNKEKYKLVDPGKVARTQVDELIKKKADVIVVLTHLDRRDAEKMLKDIEEIDLLLGGQSMGTNQYLERIGNAWWADAGQKGKYVNFITLNMAKGKRPFVVREEAAKLKLELEKLDQRIARYVKMSKGPAKPNTRTASKDRFKGVISSLVRQRDQIAVKAQNLTKASPDAPFLSFQAVAMNKKLRDQEETKKWVEEYKSKHDTKPSRSHVKQVKSAVKHGIKPTRTIPHKAIRTMGKTGLKKGGPAKTQ